MKDGSVADYVSNRTNGQWQLRFRRRRLRSAEMDEYNDLISSVNAPLLSSVGVDQLKWVSGNQVGYRVSIQSELFQERRRIRNPLINNPVPVQKIWRSKIPTKVCFFVWTAFLGRLPTRLTLQRFGRAGDAHCVFCNDQVESDIHFLFSCGFARSFWSLIRRGFQCQTWDCSSVAAAVSSWKATNLTSPGVLVWNNLLHAGLWELWKQRNARVFDGRIEDVGVIARRAKILVWCWIQREEAFKGLFLDQFVFDWEPIVSQQ